MDEDDERGSKLVAEWGSDGEEGGVSATIGLVTGASLPDSAGRGGGGATPVHCQLKLLTLAASGQSSSGHRTLLLRV